MPLEIDIYFSNLALSLSSKSFFFLIFSFFSYFSANSFLALRLSFNFSDILVGVFTLELLASIDYFAADAPFDEKRSKDLRYLI